MSDKDIALIAHLMRRAGFGATYAELEERAAQGYEATVEDLLHPERSERADEDLYLRYETVWDGNFKTASVPQFFFNMVRTRRPLEEKMALFWHGLFATAGVKVVWSPVMTQQIETFRKHGLGNFRTILVELSKDPAMLFWLDNCQSHGDAPNENYGRELLELFAMGVGNYTEDDVMAASRAFTGWTFRRIACGPYRGVQPTFQFDPADHDYGEKEFLGEKGAFNGEDIIDIVVRQPAAARFIVAKLHNFFVSDEPDEDAIAELGRVYFESGYDIKSVMRALLLSDFFKESRFAKIKSPVETIVGISRLAGDFELADGRLLSEAVPMDLRDGAAVPSENMGQQPLNPPSVEGWHTGHEWVNSGSLVERVNYAAARLGDGSKPGVRSIAGRLASDRTQLSPRELVDGCLELIGCYVVSDLTRESLEEYASQIDGDRLDTPESREAFADTVASMLRLIVATPDYQLV